MWKKQHDVTRNFNCRVKAFRKDILMAKQSQLKVHYYHDRVEFQARGHPHIHGMAWSNMEQVNEKFEGLQQTFKKLKEREHLTSNDIKPLQKFIDATVTCSISLKEN